MPAELVTSVWRGGHDEDVVGLEVAEREPAVGGGGGVELDAVERRRTRSRPTTSTNVAAPGSEQVKRTVERRLPDLPVEQAAQVDGDVVAVDGEDRGALLGLGTGQAGDVHAATVASCHMNASPPLTDVEESWPVASSTDLHRDDWVVALRADRIRRPGTDGPDFRRLVLEHPGAVVVLAIDDEERVCCLAQYRHPAGRRFVELPAGLCDEPGEEPLAVAQRELLEEAGLRAGRWTHLTSTYSSPGISSEVMHFFLARDLIAGRPRAASTSSTRRPT